MTTSDARFVVEQFWATMNTNDFRAAAEWLSEDFVLEWPQSRERIHGRENFIAINTHYPAVGRWQFVVEQMVVEGEQVVERVVTDVFVTDGEVTARAITFSTVRDGKIVQQTEYWPDPFDAPTWRAQWVEPIP